MSKKTPTIQDQLRINGLAYIGQNGAHLTGYPAQNLSGEQCQAYTTLEIETMLASGLYQINEPKKELTHE